MTISNPEKLPIAERDPIPDVIPSPLSSVEVTQFEFNRELGFCEFSHFTERTNPEKALAVQQLQGESYFDEGYITEEGLDEYGRLKSYLDQARGDSVRYVTAEINGEVMGAVRQIQIPPGGGLQDLPSYNKSVGSMFPEYRQLLESEADSIVGRGVIEISSLSRKKNAPPSVLLEVIREIFQQEIRAKSDVVWLVTATDNSFNMLRSRYGKRAVVPIGDRIPVIEGDPVTKEVGLQPSIIEPGRVFEGMALSVNEEENPVQKKRLLKSLAFLADGLSANDGEIPMSVVELIEERK